MQLRRSLAPPPDDREQAEGTKYILALPDHPNIRRNGRGEVHQFQEDLDEGKLCGYWRVQRWPRTEVDEGIRPWRTVFIYNTPEGDEVLRIRRSAWFPSTFDMHRNGETLGKIRLQSLFRNRYHIQFQHGPAWAFYMPLFTVCFSCESDAGGRVWGSLGRSELEWMVLIAAGFDDVQLVAALAFLHHQRM